MILDFLNSSVGAALVGVLGALSGVVLERWMRRWGEVRCVIGDKDWSVARSGFSAKDNGNTVAERMLKVLFVNDKDLPVTVMDMQVVFYKDGKPLEEAERPDVKVVNEQGHRSEISLVSIPPHVPVTRTLFVAPDAAHKQRALEEADRAEFVAIMLGTEDKRMELKPPWRE